MKKWIFIFIFFVLVNPAWATWTLVQNVISSACTTNSSTCAVTVASTGSGHVIFIGLLGEIASMTISSVSGGGAYTHPSACAASESGTNVRASDCAYTLASTSGTTSITVTRNSSTSSAWHICAAEVSFTASSVSVDTGNANGNTNTSTSASTSATGVTLSILGSNDVIFQILSGGTPTAINESYAGVFAAATGSATLINTTTGTAPTWTQSSNQWAASAIAVAEAAAANCKSCDLS